MAPGTDSVGDGGDAGHGGGETHETAGSGGSDYAGTSSPAKLIEIAKYYLFIGIVGFGGPMVHIAMMEDDLVGADSREWTDQSIFMEGLAICNMLPGPASTQLGIFMGWIYAGTKGALTAGFFFMLPTFVIVVFFSWLYFAYQEMPAVEALFYGINPVVIGLIVGACYSMTRSAFDESDVDRTVTVRGDTWTVDFVLIALLVATTVVMAVLGTNPVVLFIIAGLIGVVVYRSAWVRANARRLAPWVIFGAVFGLLFALRDRFVALFGPSIRGAIETSPIWGLLLALWGNTWVQLFAFMVYTGSFIYGGGLVLIPFIELYVVREFGWMTGREFVDGIAIGQLSPGPVVMTTAFVGYKVILDAMGGSVAIAVLGALVAVIGAFGPSFIFIIGFFPYFAQVRENPIVQTALTAVNPAVIGAILGATVLLARESFIVPDPSVPLPVGDLQFDAFTILLALATYWLFVRGIHAAYLIIGGGAIGIGAFFLL